MFLAQIEVDPELVRRLGLIANVSAAWGGWVLTLLLAAAGADRYRGHRWSGSLEKVVGLLLVLSLPFLANIPEVLFPAPGATEAPFYRLPASLDGIVRAVLCVYEILFAVIAVTWGTVIYFRRVLSWAGAPGSLTSPR